MRLRRVVNDVGLRDAKGQFPLLGQGDQLAKAVASASTCTEDTWIPRTGDGAS
jgi:hypothetical protein